MRALWVPLLFGLLVEFGAFAITTVWGGAGTVSSQFGRPLAVDTAAQVAVVGALEATVALVVLLGLRSLVLVRRTQASVRNWFILLALLLVAALSTTGLTPSEPVGIVTIVLYCLVVLAMLANVFRLSWVAYLPSRQKMLAALYCAGLIGMLAIALAARSGGFTTAGLDNGIAAGPAMIFVFSRPLGELTMLISSFGVLYASAALLALIFHLPTSTAFEQQRGERQAMQALADLARDVTDRDRLAETIAEAPVRAQLAQSAWLAVIEPETGSLEPRILAAAGISIDRIASAVECSALVSAAADRSDALLLERAAADHRVKARPGDGLGSLVILPLNAGGRELGALFVARNVAEAFETDDILALKTFAGQAALALQSAELIARQLQQERVTRELTIARSIQQRLLPNGLPKLNGRLNNLDAAVAEVPAYEVGGDYFDFVDLGDERFGVIVADAAGKGIAAAFYMAQLKGIFQSLSRVTRTPGEFLSRANEALYSSLARKDFVSAVYGVLDASEGTFTFARAGHCPVAMARSGGGKWHLRGNGLGLGLDPGPLFRRTLQEQVVSLRPGDSFALYSDGLVESRDAEGEEFGHERVADIMSRHIGVDAEALRDAILSERAAFALDAPPVDDLTLVVLRWTGVIPIEPSPQPRDELEVSPPWPRNSEPFHTRSLNLPTST
ncbi:hypothetical protein BH23ACT11_BH23ACT11_12320 [soil metagenome]